MVVRDTKMKEIIKLKYMKEIGLTNVNIVQGADVYLQLMSLVAGLCLESQQIKDNRVSVRPINPVNTDDSVIVETS